MIEQIPAPRSVEEVKEGLLSLLPIGKAFSGHNTKALMGSIATGKQALELFLAQVRNEYCPGTSVIMLDEYQKELGPDPLGRDQGDLSDDELRQLLQERWVFEADQTIQSYVTLAKSFGVDIWIEEPDQPVCGDLFCGDGHACGDESLMFIWIVHLPPVPSVGECGAAVCGAIMCGDVITEFYSQLVRIFQLLKPADTDIFFDLESE